MSVRTALMFALLIPAIQACDPEDPCSVAATVEPALQLGVGERAFAPLEDGDALEAEFGAQGGQHIWVAARTEGVVVGRWTAVGADIPAPHIGWSLWSRDGIQVGDGSTDVPLAGDETGAEVVGQRLFFYGQEGGEADLSELTLRAELMDTCGTQLLEEVAVTLR